MVSVVSELELFMTDYGLFNFIAYLNVLLCFKHCYNYYMTNHYMTDCYN